MTLYEYLREHPEDEVTVVDDVYDTEMYFYFEDEERTAKDVWDRAMMMLSKKLDVVEELNDCRVVVNMTALIEKNIGNGVFEKLFIDNDVDSIMCDMHNIISGYVSEEWLIDFAESLAA